MANIIRSLLNSTLCCNNSKRYFFGICGSKSKDKSKLRDKSPKPLNPERDEREKRLKEAKLTCTRERVDILDDIPQEFLQSRTARIFQPPKNVMQSGTQNTKHWCIEFDTKERWENPNIGWCSSGDPLSSIRINFGTLDEAIAYCERCGWKFSITKRSLKQKYPRQRAYLQNFVDKRCRISTK